MDSCGSACILYIWIAFLWPIIVSSFYLIIRKKQIVAKGKYFLLSAIGGYVLLVGFNFLISFLVRNFLELDSVNIKTLAIATTIILFILPVVFSHVLFKKYFE